MFEPRLDTRGYKTYPRGSLYLKAPQYIQLTSTIRVRLISLYDLRQHNGNRNNH